MIGNQGIVSQFFGEVPPSSQVKEDEQEQKYGYQLLHLTGTGSGLVVGPDHMPVGIDDRPRAFLPEPGRSFDQ